MFSDVAIAINQEDERAEKLLNQTVIHPLTKRRIKIITSPLIDKNFGTGLMKVSAHAMDDIDIIKQNNLEIIECIDDNGLLNEKANEFAGLDRFEARKKIIEFLQEKNLIEKIEDITSNVGYSERSQVPIEILVRPQ
jgi:valine--tRNA ligase